MSKRRKDKQMRAAIEESEVGLVEVPNPLRIRVPDLKRVGVEFRYVEDRISAPRTLRDDQLGRLHHRRQVSEAQYAAGRHWQRLFDQAAIGRIRSSGDLRDPVDGSPRYPDPLTDRQQQAMKALGQLDGLLGELGSAVVRAILAENMNYTQVARQWGDGSRASTEHIGWLFRWYMSRLAARLGYGC
jgi:hypothetical protein